MRTNRSTNEIDLIKHFYLCKVGPLTSPLKGQIIIFARIFIFNHRVNTPFNDIVKSFDGV